LRPGSTGVATQAVSPHFRYSTSVDIASTPNHRRCPMQLLAINESSL